MLPAVRPDLIAPPFGSTKAVGAAAQGLEKPRRLLNNLGNVHRASAGESVIAGIVNGLGGLINFLSGSIPPRHKTPLGALASLNSVGCTRSSTRVTHRVCQNHRTGGQRSRQRQTGVRYYSWSGYQPADQRCLKCVRRAARRQRHPTSDFEANEWPGRVTLQLRAWAPVIP